MPRMMAGAEGGVVDPFRPADVDLIGGGQSSGAFGARLLQSGGNLASMRTLAVLRRDEWEEYDKAVVQLARGRFTMVSDLMAAGLRYSLTNPLATMSLVWDRIGTFDDAQIDMTAEAASIRDRLEYEQDGMPVPIIHKGFRVNLRHLLASRKYGQGVDVTHAQEATIKVVEMVEKLFLFGNWSAGTTFGRIYGVTTFPQRNTGSLTAAWTSATPAQIFDDVNRMVAALEGDNMFGPYGLYVPKNYGQVLRKDYDTDAGTASRSIAKRLLDIEGLQFVRTNQFMPANTVVLVQLTPNVIEVIDGIQPRIVEWTTEGGMVSLFKVMAIMLPRIKRDGANNCGLAHFAP